MQTLSCLEVTHMGEAYRQDVGQIHKTHDYLAFSLDYVSFLGLSNTFLANFHYNAFFIT